MKLLIAEDDDLVQRTILRAFRSTSVEIHFAANGLEALSRLRETSYALIVSDVDMPKMGGVALYARLREEFPGLCSRFAFFTSNHGDDVRSQIGDPGVPVFDKAELGALKAFVLGAATTV